MNPDDVLPDEMEGSIRRVNDLDPLDGTDAADLALFAEDLRTAFPEAPLPERVAEDHIAAMIGAIQLLADKGESALEPTSNAFGPDRRASGLPKLRKRTMKKKMLISVAVTAAMLVSLGGLAHAGVLPEPIQGAVGSVLGIDDEGDQGNIDDGVVGDTDEGAVSNTDDGGQGNTDDGGQGNVDEGAVGNVDEGNVGNGGQGNGGQGNAGNGGQGNAGNGGQGNVGNGGQGNGGQGNVGNGGQGNGGQGNVGNGGQGNVGNGGQGNVGNGGQGNGGQGNVGNGGQGNVGNGGQGNVGNGGQGMDRSRAASSLLRGSAGRRRAPDEAWRDRGSIRVPSATSRSRRHA